MPNTYIKVGTRVRVYDGSVTSNDHLEVGTYSVAFSPNDGFSLVQTGDLQAGLEKIYGNHSRKVDKVFNTYHRHGDSLGVMLSGDKGQGKTLFLRMLAHQAQIYKLPVVLVNENYGGIASFLDTLGECMIVFDEFEKVFPHAYGEDDANYQNQFLPLFDGASRQKRLYCITVNQLRDLSDYLHNRPGRFHYHLRFNYPDAAAIREYLNDQAPTAPVETVDAAVRFANQAKINYDHLRAIAMEINNDPTIQFSELIEDLNIKSLEAPDYLVTVVFADGSIGTGTVAMTVRDRETVSLNLSAPHGIVWAYLDGDKAEMDHAGTIMLPKENLRIRTDDVNAPAVSTISLKILGQDTYSYNAL